MQCHIKVVETDGYFPKKYLEKIIENNKAALAIQGFRLATASIQPVVGNWVERDSESVFK